MNLLADMLDGSSLIDTAVANGENALTLSWLAENGEDAWSRVAGAVPEITVGSEPSLASIVDGLAGHPMTDYLSGGYLPLVRADYWESNIAAPPEAATAVEPDDWIEFISGSSGVHGVLVPEYPDSSYQLGLFTGTERLDLSVVVDLGRRLRVRRVSITASEEGCGMSDDGDCQSDGRCLGACEKVATEGRLRRGVRCACVEPLMLEPFIGSSLSDTTLSAAYPGQITLPGSA